MNEQHEESNHESGRTGSGPAILTTDRLILCGPRAEDAQEIAEIANNRRIAEQTRHMPHPYGVKDALRRVWRADRPVYDTAKISLFRVIA